MKKINKYLRIFWISCVFLQVFLIVSTVTVDAQQQSGIISIDEFLYGMPIQVERSSPIQEITLPYEFFTGISRSDYGDLRVFNSDMQLVPHALVLDDENSSHIITRAMSFFPVYAESNDKDLVLRIDRDKSGAIINVNNQVGSLVDDQKQLVAYIIDNSLDEYKDMNLIELQFQWNISSESIIGSFKLEGSNDLQTWVTILPEFALSSLSFLGKQLLRNKVEINTTKLNYLKLSWEAGRPFIDITKIEARYSKGEVRDDWMLRRGLKLELNEEDNSYYFNIGGPIAIEKIEFAMAQNNSLLTGRVYSRRDKDANWQYRDQFLQYNLVVERKAAKSEPIVMAGLKHAEWRIVFDQPEYLAELQLPELSVYWQPVRLLFMSQKAGDYTLAYGHSKLSPSSGGMSQIFKQLQYEVGSKPVKAHVGTPYVLNDNPAKKPLINWNVVILWLVLVFGVSLMGWMAYKLFRQINQEPAS